MIWKPRNPLIDPSNVSQGKQNDYLCTKDLSDFVDCQFENAPWIHACYFGKSTSDEQNYSHLRRLPCCAKEKLFTVRWDLLPWVFDREHHILAVLKFIYSEKATKFCEIFTLLLTVCTVVKSKVKIVAFSEYMNFTIIQNIPG